MEVGRTYHVMFEALFDWGLSPNGAFADALEDVGYCPSKPEPHYPSTVWRAALEVARRFVFQHDREDVAYRALGRACAAGWMRTPLGPLFAEIMPVVPPRAFLARLPSYGRLGRTDSEVELLELSGSSLRMRHRDPQGIHPAFTLGAMERTLESMGFQLDSRVEGTGEEHLITLQWWKTKSDGSSARPAPL